MERTEVETDWFEEPSPAGSKRQGYVTYEEREKYLVDHIRACLLKRHEESRYKYLTGYPVLTIHECWDGYSEYTVTDTWNEVQVEWDGLTAYFESTPEFLLALAEGRPG